MLLPVSPTQRSLKAWRDVGATAAVVERWNPHAKIRQDLFGCIDIVVATPDIGIIGVQACAAASHAARVEKAYQQPGLAAWLKAGGLFRVESWGKKGARGKRKTWQMRVEWITRDSARERSLAAVAANGESDGKA